MATPRHRITRDALVERVGRLPRVRIAALPTPLEEMPRLRAALGPDAPRLFVKRDDLTGLAFGGNKVRHLEFRTADALKKGADTMIVTNVAQSNHARLHTAVAAKFGLTNYIIKIPSKKDASDPGQSPARSHHGRADHRGGERRSGSRSRGNWTA